MPESRHTHTTTELRPSVWEQTGPEVSEVIHLTCQALAGSLAVQRIDVTLQSDHDVERRLSLIRQAKNIAREWGLDMYVRFLAGVVRLTFVKRTDRSNEDRMLKMRNGNRNEQTS